MLVFVLLGVLVLGSGIFQCKVLRVHLSDPERVRCVKEVTYVIVITSYQGGGEVGGCKKVTL